MPSRKCGRGHHSESRRILLLVGCSRRPSSKAAGGARTGGVPSGYTEDSCKPRTPLADFFRILLLRKGELGKLGLVESLFHQSVNIEQPFDLQNITEPGPRAGVRRSEE